LMMENTWYSVISPESCSSILWRSWNYKEQAAEALKLTADDMLLNGLIDGIIPEPLGGAHLAPEVAAANIKEVIIAELKVLSAMSVSERIDQRIEKFGKMGVVVE
jgi:acetyl-CoA carboxylase carboxyl transferase subunit alpha